MKRITVLILFILFTIPCVGQINEAQKLSEFSDLPCSVFGTYVSAILQDSEKIPDSKIYVIYYEGKHNVINVWNKKLKTYETKLLAPRKSDALNRAKEIELYLKSDLSYFDEVVLTNGGYRNQFELEVWAVPKNAQPPKSSPTLTEENMTFRKGKPFPVRDCARIYDNL